MPTMKPIALASAKVLLPKRDSGRRGSFSIRDSAITKAPDKQRAHAIKASMAGEPQSRVVLSGQLIARSGRYKIFPVIGTGLMTFNASPAYVAN